MSTIEEMQEELENMRRKLKEKNDIQGELENVKRELEQGLEAHKRLQEVALALEEENRIVSEKYKIQLRDRANLDKVKLDLESELETKTLNYDNLEKRFLKMKEKIITHENMEDLVYSLQKDKKRNTERIKELEEEVEVSNDGNGLKIKEQDERIQKLEKEKKEISVNLETYMEEMEELDAKNEHFEKENNELKKKYEQVKSIELVGSNMVVVAALETEKEDLESKLKKEIAKRELVENELFKLEEELEAMKMAEEEMEEKMTIEVNKINQDLLGRKVPSDSIDKTTLDNSNSDIGMKFLLKKKQKHIENIEKENKLYQTQIKSLEQEHQILLDENSALAKENMDLDDQLSQMKSKYETKTKHLQDRLDEAEDNCKIMEQEKIDRLATSKEKEDEHTQRNQENNKENERLKQEIIVIQEYLKLATDKNVELQNELEGVKRDFHKQQQYTNQTQEHNNNMETSSTTSSTNSQESEKSTILHRMALKYDEEKEEYESKIYELNHVIKSLEDRILSLRSFHKNRNNGNLSSPDTTPPVAIRNGRLHDSMDELSVPRSKSMDFSEEDTDKKDLVSERELRRISYRIADGNWKYLGNELNIRRKQDVNQVLHSNFNDQEKVYRLLVCWRNEHELTRDDFLKQLIDKVGSKRKDVTKFLKDISRVQTKEGTIKTKFQKLRKSVKR